MSLIIATKTKDRVIMMCDSVTTSNPNYAVINDEIKYKTTRVKDVLVGTAGRVAAIRRLTAHPEWFETNGEPFDKRFIVKNIIPRFFRDLDEHGLTEEYDGMPAFDGGIILAHKDKIFQILRGFEVHEMDKVAAIGCTRTLVAPILGCIKEGEELETMLKAQRLSAELSRSVGPPYLYIDTVDFEYKTVEE